MTFIYDGYIYIVSLKAKRPAFLYFKETIDILYGDLITGYILSLGSSSGLHSIVLELHSIMLEGLDCLDPWISNNQYCYLLLLISFNN